MTTLYLAIINTLGIIIVAIIQKRLDNQTKDNKIYRQRREELENIEKYEKYLLTQIQLAEYNIIEAMALDDNDGCKKVSVEKALGEVHIARAKYQEFLQKTAYHM